MAWPLMFAAGIALYGKRWFPKVIMVGALVSALLMALLFIPGTDPSRVYFGTDTRAAGLLVGSLLAFAWVPGRLSNRPRLAGRALLSPRSASSLLAALVLCTMFASEYGTFLYQGGFLLVALLSAMLVATASHPGGAPAKVLGWAPLVWLGSAFVRHLPLALAGVHADPPPHRCPLRRTGTVRRTFGHHAAACRHLIPVDRAAVPSGMAPPTSSPSGVASRRCRVGALCCACSPERWWWAHGRAGLDRAPFQPCPPPSPWLRPSSNR